MSVDLSGASDYTDVVFSSADFSSGTQNAPIFSFQQAIDLNNDFFALRWVQFPTSYYVFSSGYTSCTINGTAVTWPQGNYTPQEWINIVVPQLTNITITYDPITNKLIFTHTLANPITIVFSTTQLAFSLLGLLPGTNTGASPYSTPNCANFSGPNYMYLHSNFVSVFNQNKLYNSRQTAFPNNASDVMAMIPITVNRNAVNYYTPSEYSYHFTPTDFTHRLSFYFTLGERPEVVDFNGLPFQVALSGKQIIA